MRNLAATLGTKLTHWNQRCTSSDYIIPFQSVLASSYTGLHPESHQAETPVIKESHSIFLSDALNLIPPSKRGVSEKKRKGVYYTPDEAADLLAEWGIRKPTDTVLEPSFGGCGFLDATLNILKLIGVSKPHNQLFGCDIDPEAFVHLSRLFGTQNYSRNFKRRDFLQVSPEDFQVGGVDVVIGNPPYVSWHNMLPSQRETAAKVVLPSGEILNQKSSLWAFFVAHSLHYLKSGGRMAWILPGSFIYADYAAPLRAIISQQFTRSLAIMLEQRIFVNEGTEESSVILLCEGYEPSILDQPSLRPLHFVLASTLPELQTSIRRWANNQSVGVEWDQQANRLLVPTGVMETYDRLCASRHFKKLGALVRIRIGLVTGDNSFFVVKKSKARELNIPLKLFRQIVARQAHFRGLQVTQDDLLMLTNENLRCLLLNTNLCKGKRKPKSLIDYLSTYPQNDIDDNRTFAKREPWHQIAQEVTPDGFFTCMNWSGPVLVLNGAQTTCTNTIYRVDFDQPLFDSPDIKQQTAVCLQSTFSQFSAEISGRSYGSGALKLEPSEASRIALLLPPTDADASVAFDQIDICLRRGQVAGAREIADQFLIQHGLLTESDTGMLKEGLSILRNIRRGDRSPAE